MAIHQSITIKTSPEKVYNALISSEIFSEFTGAPAAIDNSEGGAFSCFGGQIVGRNIKLEPNERIIQAWRAGPWSEAAYSIVVFEIEKSGDSTTIELAHTGYPADSAEELEGGWHKMYWDPLKAFLE